MQRVRDITLEVDHQAMIRAEQAKTRTVVFDAYWWVRGPTSLRHVLRGIVSEWVRQCPDDDLVIVVRRKHFAIALLGCPPGVTVVASRYWPQAFFARYGVAGVAKARKADLVLVHNFAYKGRSTSAVFLHDVLFVTNPEWFTRAERLYFALMLKWIRSADVVFTSSLSEAKRIRTHTVAKTVVPIGIGLSEELLNVKNPRAFPGLVCESFILTVGRLNARKNLAVVIQAAVDSGAADASRPLVIVGEKSGRFEGLSDKVRAAVEEGSVILTGHIGVEQLSWLYANCELFVFLPLDEGFGMPPMEALHFQRRIVASDIPVMRENLGEFATFVNPWDADAAGSTILSALQSRDSIDLAALSSWLLDRSWGRTVRELRQAAVHLIPDGEARI